MARAIRTGRARCRAAVRELLKRGLAAEGFEVASEGAKSKDYGVIGSAET